MADARDRPKAKSLRPLRALVPFLLPHRWILGGALAALLVAAAVHFAIEKPAVAGLRTVFRAYDAARRQPARNAVAP